MSKYFDKFPLIEYKGSLVKNILAKIDFTDRTRNDIHSSFDFVLSEHNKRPDNLSHNYYNSPFYDWLIYITNNVVDPYHDYYKDDNEMREYIIQKYGSIRAATDKILFYRNNWAPDDGIITSLQFDNLHNNIQQYYKPVISNSNQILHYVRKQVDWVQSTNKIICIKLKNAEFFDVGNVINQNGSSATIINVDKEQNNIIAQHVIGSFEIDENILDVRTLSQNIPDIEASFWNQVTAIDDEYERNELRKYISFIKSSYLPDIEKQFNELLS